MSQYALSLSLPPVFSDDNFFVSECNREAHQWITAWPEWPAKSLLLYGPAGSGKSHLGHIWAARAKASVFDASGGNIPAPDAIRSHWLIEGIEHIRDERSLLHALNFSKEHGDSLLLTSTLPPKRLPFTLPDLTSRLLALPAAHIDSPDDAALMAAMQKQFADLQLKVSPDVIAWLLPRMERSFAGVQELVGKLDAGALAEHKELTIPFVRKILGF